MVVLADDVAIAHSERNRYSAATITIMISIIAAVVVIALIFVLMLFFPVGVILPETASGKQS